MTNTNRLASLTRTLKHGAIITTATASILMLTAVVASGKPADVGAKPTKQEILTLLRQMSVDSKEFKCNKEIMRKESNYNPSAKNGSHYGLYQGRSQYLHTATIEEQIQWYRQYIRARYSGDGCKALSHHVKHNWY
jgi:hypothetical protein